MVSLMPIQVFSFSSRFSSKSHADDTSYKLSSRSTSPPPTTSAVASSSSHQDNNINRRSSLDFRFSSFSAYQGQILPTKDRIICMEKDDHQDKGYSITNLYKYSVSHKVSSVNLMQIPTSLMNYHHDRHPYRLQLHQQLYRHLIRITTLTNGRLSVFNSHRYLPT